MVEWFNLNNIMSKKDVWTIIKRSRPPHPEYSVDQLAKSAGHDVVCLPVAHSKLNSIEMAWLQTEMERLTHAGFDVVAPMRWKSLIAHVQTKTEDYYWVVVKQPTGYTILVDGL